VANAAIAQTPKPVKTTKTFDEWVLEAIQKTYSELKSSGRTAPGADTAFNGEVLSAAMVFVRNYEVTRETTSVDVDRDRLRGFLNFSRDTFTNRPDVSICVGVRRLADCAMCGDFALEIQKGVTALLNKRGVQAVAGPEFASDSTLTGERAFEDYALRAQGQGCDFALLSTISASSDASVEAGSLKIDTALLMRDRRQRSLRAQSTFKISEAAVLELTTNKTPKLAVNVVAEVLAVAANRAKEEVVNVGLGQEGFLKIENLPNYATLLVIKNRLNLLVKGLELKERFLTPGAIEFVYPISFKEDLHHEAKREANQFGGIGGVNAEVKGDSTGLTIRIL